MGEIQEKLSPGLGQNYGGGPLVGMLPQGLGELDLEAGGAEPRHRGGAARAHAEVGG